MSFHTPRCDHSPRARNLGVWSQVDLKKHHKTSWRWWNSSWSISKPKRWRFKVLHSICQQIWKSQQLPQDSKRSDLIPVPKKGNDKEFSNYCTIALISHASKVMLKILQAQLQYYMNKELSDIQTGFRKGRGTRDKNANIHWILEKARGFQKNIYCFTDYAKAFTAWMTTKCGKFFKRWEYQTTLQVKNHLCAG